MQGNTSELANHVVRAGAGAGKTTNLTQTVVRVAESFFLKHQRLPQLIVTTFTRKATEELRERITTELFNSDHSKLMDLVTSRQQLQISTIHGVLSLFLRQYGHLAGLEAGFKVADTEASYQMAKNILHDIFPEFTQASLLMENYNFESILEILLIRRAKKHERPDLESFSVSELEEAAGKIITPILVKYIETLGKIEASAENPKWVEYCSYVKNAAREAQKDFDLSAASEKIKSFGRKPPYLKKNPPFTEGLKSELDLVTKEFDSLVGKFGLQKSNFPLFANLSKALDLLGEQFDKKLKEEKYRSGRLDSEDLELFTIDILRSEPELGRAFASQWDYWLVDEYQDTSPLQVEIMSHLRGERPVYLVGDPQQSIYLFRGARVEVFEAEAKRLLSTGGQSTLLSKNYRSRPELLEAINEIVEDLGPHFLPMEPREKHFDASVEAVCILKASKSDEMPYQGIVNFIIEKLQESEEKNLDDFCVLARANSTLIDVAKALETAGISVCVHAARGYFTRREVIDLLSILKFLVNPHDNLNLIRLLKSPWFRLADEKIADLNARGVVSYWSYALDVHSEVETISALKASLVRADTVGYIESFRELVFDSGLIDFSHWHDPTGRRESNIWKLITDLRAQERSAGFNPIEIFRRFERALQKQDDESDAVASKEPNRVNLMTVHKSKGLKFKYVILPNMEKKIRLSNSRGHEMKFIESESTGRWGVVAPLGNGGEMKHSSGGLLALEDLSLREKEESLRLLYVAVTRAQESLCFHGIQDPIKEFDKDSWAGLLSCWRLSVGRHQKDRYSIGVQEAPFEVLDYKVIRPKSNQDVREPFEKEWTPSPRQRFSVTSLVEGEGQSSGTKLTNNNFDQIARSIRAPSVGSIVHGVFERLRYNAKFDFHAYLDMKLGDKAPSYIEGTEYVLGLDSPPMQQLISSGEVEWGFQVKTQKGVLEGQIDLWSHYDNITWVVDYKSGSAAHIEKAFQQLKYYAWALNRAFGYTDFKLAVVYPLAGQVKVRDFSDLSEIKL